MADLKISYEKGWNSACIHADLPMGDELGIEVFRVIYDNLDSLKDEIITIRKSVGDEWVNKNYKEMADILISLKTKMSMF